MKMIQQPSFSMIHKVSGAASHRFYDKGDNKTLTLHNFIFVNSAVPQENNQPGAYSVECPSEKSLDWKKENMCLLVSVRSQKADK